MSGVRTGPSTITVSADGSGDHKSISAAVKAAPDGATIMVRPGSYTEKLVLTRPVTIVPESDGPVVLQSRQGTAVTVTAGSSTLRQLTVSGQDPAAAVIEVTGGSLTLEGCEVTAAARAAIEARGAVAAVFMRDGRVRNSAGLGVQITDGAAGTFERIAIEHVRSLQAECVDKCGQAIGASHATTVNSSDSPSSCQRHARLSRPKPPCKSTRAGPSPARS